MLNITTRLTLWYLAAFGTTILIVAVSIYGIFSTSERRQVDIELQDYAGILLAEVDASHPHLSGIYNNLVAVTGQVNLRFHAMRFLLTTQDSIIYGPDDPQTSLLADSLERLLPISQAEQFFTVRVGKENFRAYARPVSVGNSELNLVVAIPLARLNKTLDNLRNLLFLLVPLSLVLAGIGGWVLARRALTPVAIIRQAAARISSTNLHERVPLGNANDELHDLAATFNTMIERLEQTFEGQQRFVADASHDLRTPLSTISARLEMAAMRVDLPDDLRADLVVCRAEIDRLVRLSSDLLLLARSDAGQLSTVRKPERLDEMLLEAISRNRRGAEEKEITLRVDVDEENVVEVYADAGEMIRAIANLVENAIRYAPPKSVVDAGVVLQDGTALLTITDRGPGILPEDLPHIFDRFYRADRARQTPGSGLGLSIARTIVRNHGGEVVIAATSEQGTTVAVNLPPYHLPIIFTS